MGARCGCSRKTAVSNFDHEGGEGHDIAGLRSGEIIVVNKSMFAFKYAVGKGNYGLVWKGTKKSNSNDYAIKVMEKA